MRWSLLDQGVSALPLPARDRLKITALLCQEADAAGFERFWVTEHHAPREAAQASPAVLLAHLGSLTSRIRLGAGAVLLPYYPPLKVAEDFLLLEALFPGRVDLGLGRGPGATPAEREALLEGQLRAATPEDHARKVREVMGLLHRDLPDGHPRRDVVPTPAGVSAPEVWIMATAEGGARLAGSLGARVAFGAFLRKPDEIEPALDQVVRAYRESFVPRAPGDVPVVMPVFSILAAASPSEARRLDAEAQARGKGPEAFVGDPAQCADAIRALGLRYKFDRAMIRPSAVMRASEVAWCIGEFGGLAAADARPLAA